MNSWFDCDLCEKIWQFYISCPVGIGLGCISKWLGWIPTVAPLCASTSPPPPLPYFQHIKLSVPKRKIWYKLNNHLQLHLYFLPLFQRWSWRKVKVLSRQLQKKLRLNILSNKSLNYNINKDFHCIVKKLTIYHRSVRRLTTVHPLVKKLTFFHPVNILGNKVKNIPIWHWAIEIKSILQAIRIFRTPLIFSLI